MNFKRLRFDEQTHFFLDDFYNQIQLINSNETSTVLNSILVSE